MSFRKGSIVATWTPWKVIPLFIPDEDEWQTWKGLPRFSSSCSSGGGTDERRVRPPLTLSDASQKWIQRQLLRSNDDASSAPLVSSIVAALNIIQDDNDADTIREMLTRDENNRDGWGDDDDDTTLNAPTVRQSWNLVRERISLPVWKALIRRICRHMHIVHREHPLVTYAVHQVPHLNSDEIKNLVDILSLEQDCSDSTGLHRSSALAVQKLLRDRVAQSSTDNSNGGLWFYLVLPSTFLEGNLSDPMTYPHSCLPTAQLELLPNGTISVVALFDCDSNTVTLCYAKRDDDHEQRDETLQQRLGSSCTCLRCRYEMLETSSSSTTSSLHSTLAGEVAIPASLNLSTAQACRLAHCYMSLGGDSVAKAQRLYRYALQQKPTTHDDTDKACLLVIADIYHALGAIELSRGKFLAAQRIWQQATIAATANNESSQGTAWWRKHKGIALQVEKAKAYEYLTRHSDHVSDPTRSLPYERSMTTTTSPIPGVYVVPVLDASRCAQVIRWAKDEGKWTKQRHYEVPTHDVPIHTVPPLLAWFQHEFMVPIMQPILAQCFNKKGHCFHVHDAFCVRYQAGLSSNHLPIHTDESTHSFVLALNDDFDGGGTYFYNGNVTVRPDVGSVLCFSGSELLHGGEALVRGTRYILTAFLYYDEDLNVDGDESDAAVVLTSSKRSRSEPMQQAPIAKLPKSDFSFDFAFGT